MSGYNDYAVYPTAQVVPPQQVQPVYNVSYPQEHVYISNAVAPPPVLVQTSGLRVVQQQNGAYYYTSPPKIIGPITWLLVLAGCCLIGPLSLLFLFCPLDDPPVVYQVGGPEQKPEEV